ncbi:dipeptidase [Rhizobium alvei]|uniref:Membrane dipeptidase n=1 Tax=Rhizobium alvei TaxID=1132659 RepID=A0ABT8YF90_9HYPH|nr:membrane dipeptidase [Rhizobium alvei]MDO6962386.1 membrane dipeptidase [Rhizobium alvei]
MISRRKLLTASGILVAAGVAGTLAAPTILRRFIDTTDVPVGFDLTEAELQRAEEFLANHPAIDSHAHPGRTFVKGASNLTIKLKLYQAAGTFEDEVVADMVKGKMSAAAFSAVADFPLLDSQDGGLVSVRPFLPGEAMSYYREQVANLKALASRGLISLALEPGDIETALKAGKPAGLLAVEGADFVDDDPSNIARSAEDGVRIITLVHYLSGGRIGDIMTAPPVNKGLTDFGRAVVQEIEKSRIILDISHADEKTAFDTLAITTRPVIATHTHITGLGIGSARFISKELAGKIADSGGFIGAWPAGFGIATLEAYLGRIEQLISAIGDDHVAIGTDMDANYKPVWETYRKTPMVVAGLFKRGHSEERVAKIIGGNFLRVFGEIRG